jgi:hypothetical protein
VFIVGSSMGGGGALALALRYPNVFAAVYAGLPTTNWQTSTYWIHDVVKKWGTIASNIPIENRGPHAAALAAFNGMGVWDWQNYQQQLAAAMNGRDTAYICFGAHMQDTAIIWAAQGQPFPGVLYQGRIAFSGADAPGPHGWPGYIGSDSRMIGGTTLTSGWENFQFRRDLSLPAFSNVSNAPPVPPPTSTTATYGYNLDLEWAVPWNAFGPLIVDTPTSYAISLRSTSVDQTADVTLHRLQQFVVQPGATYAWSNYRLSDGVLVGSGTVTADGNGLLTVPAVQITRAGNRLVLAPSSSDSSVPPSLRLANRAGSGTGPSPLNAANPIRLTSGTPAAGLPAGQALNPSGVGANTFTTPFRVRLSPSVTAAGSGAGSITGVQVATWVASASYAPPGPGGVLDSGAGGGDLQRPMDQAVLSALEQAVVRLLPVPVDQGLSAEVAADVGQGAATDAAGGRQSLTMATGVDQATEARLVTAVFGDAGLELPTIENGPSSLTAEVAAGLFLPSFLGPRLPPS